MKSEERKNLEKLLWLIEFRRSYIISREWFRRMNATSGRFARAAGAFCRVVSRAVENMREFGRQARILQDKK